jgi:hypothetical protein
MLKMIKESEALSGKEKAEKEKKALKMFDYVIA